MVVGEVRAVAEALQRRSGLLDLPDRLEVVPRRHFWRKSTARKLFSGLGQRRRRGWDAQGCGVGLKRGSPLISACVLGWRSAGIAAGGCSAGKADLIVILRDSGSWWSF